MRDDIVIIAQFVKAMQALSEPNVSRGFDEIDVDQSASDINVWRSGLLDGLITEFRARGEWRTIMLVFSLEVTERIVQYNDFLNLAFCFEETPPTIYLLDHPFYFDNPAEDYKCKLSNYFNGHDLTSLFRSWRNEPLAGQITEFYNAIYVWSSCPAPEPAPIR